MNAKPHTARDRNRYRQQLQKLVDRLASGVTQLEAEALRPTGSEGTAADSPTREPVHSSSEADEDVARSILMSEEQILAESRAALERIESGQFGRCERCGRNISNDRLDALPYTRTCITCARSE